MGAPAVVLSPRRSDVAAFGERRAVLVSAIAIAAGSLFVTTYSLALGEPMPHRIPAALVGRMSDSPTTVTVVQQVADHRLELEALLPRDIGWPSRRGSGG